MTPPRLRAGLNRALSVLVTEIPLLGRLWGRWAPVRVNTDVPWAPVTKLLHDCRATLITTGGVHLAHDTRRRQDGNGRGKGGPRDSFHFACFL